MAQEILARSAANIQEYLKAGAWREVKLVLRFLGCMQDILEGDGVFPILDELFSRAADLQTASSEDVSQRPSLSSIRLIECMIELGPRIGQGHPPYNTLCYVIFSDRS